MYRRIFLKKISQAVFFCLPSASLLSVTNLTVNVVGDANVASGGTFAVAAGDLRGVLNYINENPGDYSVTFSLGTPTITLNASLPILNLNAFQNVTIDGTNGGSQIVLDGNNFYPGFFAEQGAISLSKTGLFLDLAP